MGVGANNDMLISVYLCLHTRSYMSVHVILNLLNELGKRGKMRGSLTILSLFRNEFNKCNNAGAQMLDFIYHVTFKLLKRETSRFFPSFTQCYN